MESLLESVWPSSPQNPGEPRCPGAPGSRQPCQPLQGGELLRLGFPGTKEGLEILLTPLRPNALSPGGRSLAPSREIWLQKKKRESLSGWHWLSGGLYSPGPAGSWPLSPVTPHSCWGRQK